VYKAPASEAIDVTLVRRELTRRGTDERDCRSGRRAVASGARGRREEGPACGWQRAAVVSDGESAQAAIADWDVWQCRPGAQFLLFIFTESRTLALSPVLVTT
jgi:hypothetical protein